jgi:hypothetical protein
MFPQEMLSATAAAAANVIAAITAMSLSSRVGPGRIRRIAQIDRKIRQSAAKSQESIMYNSIVWRIRIYQSSRSRLFRVCLERIEMNELKKK